MNTYKCAVVIPAKNAINILPRVLSQVLSQKTEWPYEVIVIDSGSTDGTVEYLRKLKTIFLIEISPAEFGHGKTRNLGVQVADAEFVAFLTHDAIPTDDKWLANLIAVADQSEKIAGVFGRHIAHENASPFVKNDLFEHFNGFDTCPHIVNRDTSPQRYATEQGWRQFLHFYSDNNSLLRKSVWKKIPYPDVEFAEDQLWAQSIIEAGYCKAYAPTATVYHSHDYGIFEQFQRGFDEARNFKKYFGYQLSPSLVMCFVSIGKSVVEAATRNFCSERIGLSGRVRRAILRAMLVAGSYIGTHYELLPPYIADRFSRDQKLFRGSRLESRRVEDAHISE